MADDEEDGAAGGAGAGAGAGAAAPAADGADSGSVTPSWARRFLLHRKFAKTYKKLRHSRKVLNDEQKKQLEKEYRAATLELVDAFLPIVVEVLHKLIKRRLKKAVGSLGAKIDALTAISVNGQATVADDAVQMRKVDGVEFPMEKPDTLGELWALTDPQLTLWLNYYGIDDIHAGELTALAVTWRLARLCKHLGIRATVMV